MYVLSDPGLRNALSTLADVKFFQRFLKVHHYEVLNVRFGKLAAESHIFQEFQDPRSIL